MTAQAAKFLLVFHLPFFSLKTLVSANAENVYSLKTIVSANAENVIFNENRYFRKQIHRGSHLYPEGYSLY
jgi:hypothetical protein